MNKLKFTISMLAITLLFSCSNPLDTVYVKDSDPKDNKEVFESLELEQRKLLFAAVMRSSFDKEFEVEGKTFGEIIESQKEYNIEKERKEAEREAKEEQLRKEREAKLMALRNSVDVIVTGKRFNNAEYSWDEALIYTFSVNNKAEKDIKALKGAIIINDQFDKELQRLGFEYEKPLLKGEQKEVTYQYGIGISAKDKIKSVKLEDTKILWEPEIVIFSDGEQLSL